MTAVVCDSKGAQTPPDNTVKAPAVALLTALSSLAPSALENVLRLCLRMYGSRVVGKPVLTCSVLSFQGRKVANESFSLMGN